MSKGFCLVGSIRCNPVLYESDVVPDLGIDLYPHFPNTEGEAVTEFQTTVSQGSSSLLLFLTNREFGATIPHV